MKFTEEETEQVPCSHFWDKYLPLHHITAPPDSHSVWEMVELENYRITVIELPYEV